MEIKNFNSLADNTHPDIILELDWTKPTSQSQWDNIEQPAYNPFIDYNPHCQSTNKHPAQATSSKNPMLAQILKKLKQLDSINSRLSRLKGTKLQAKPAQTSQLANQPKSTPNPTTTASVSWANVAAKGNTKALEVRASSIASTIKRDIAKPLPAQSNNKNFVVCFKTLPITQPNLESIFLAMQECLDAANRTLGKGRLTCVQWTLKASLRLSFSNSASIMAIKNTIPLLMDKLKMPKYEFGLEVLWSCLVITNVPTRMGGPMQHMCNHNKLTQILWDLLWI